MPMMVSFSGAFSPTEDETRREQELLRRIRDKGIAEKACSFCKHSQMYVFGHGECEFKCKKTKEDVTFVEGRECFEEDE